MARRPQTSSGRSQSNLVVPLSIFVVLFLFSFATLIYAWQSWQASEAKILAGYQRGPDSSFYEDIDVRTPDARGYISLLVNKDRELFELRQELNRYKSITGLDSLTLLETRLDSYREDIKRMAGQPSDGENLVLYIRHLASTLETLRANIKIAEAKQTDAERLARERLNLITENNTRHDNRVRDLTATIATKDRQLAEERRTLQAQIGELAAKIGELEDARLTQRRQFEDTMRTLRNEVAVSRQALEEVQSAKVGGTAFNIDYAEADGKILSRDGRSCMVDIGQKDGAKPGLQFIVYETGPGGQRRAKGKIELKSIHPDFSLAGVVELYDRLDPILPDDIVISPVFKRGASTIFVFDTDLDRADQAVLRQRIERFGSQVHDRVTPDTDFVVIKSTPGDMAMEARQWAVRVIRVSDVNKVLGN